jgi:hypothetical protein
MVFSFFGITSYIFGFVYNIYKTVSCKLIVYPNVKFISSYNKKFYNYNLLIDDKYHRLTFLKDSCIDFDYIKKNKHLFIDTILNCTVTVNETDYDFTKEFQQFHHLSSINWSDCFEFLFLDFNKNKKNNILQNGYIQITLNDNDLTMYQFKISDNLHKKFFLQDTDSTIKMY